MSVQTHKYLKLASLVILLLLVAFAIVALLLLTLNPAMPDPWYYIMPAHLIMGPAGQP